MENNILILSRIIGEKIIIGKNSEVIFRWLDVYHNHASVGIDAPTAITIYRKEIYQRILLEKKNSATNEVKHIETNN